MEFDLGATRWAEDPTMIVELVRMQLDTPRAESVATRMERLAEDRRGAIEKAVANSRFWRRPMMRALGRLVELYMPLREAPKHYGVFVFRRIRLAVMELGRRLHARAVLHTPEEVFFLEYRELEALIHGQSPPPALHDLIRARRDQLDRFRSEPASDVLRSDGVPVREDRVAEGTDSFDGVLRGTPVSAGVASGPVRVLAQPDPRAMTDGDIIVMRFADPGWTPLFPRSRAVVMEVGGLMCHAAVVAREMGIPAVFGVADATRVLVNGQLVRVDGAAGTVTRL
jgi:pyruvate,water dikinase